MMTDYAHLEQPLISVITIVRNGARFLSHALVSIFQQTYCHLQVIVVDGQSTDGSDLIAQSFPRVICVRQETLGIGSARNLGIEHVSGDFIAFLDCDDLWAPTKLTMQLHYMLANPADTRLTVACDSEWFVRARRRGVAGAVLLQVLLRKRLHNSNMSLKDECYRSEWLQVLRRWT